MSLGTVAYNKKIYNLDYMTEEELENLLNDIEKDRLKLKKEIKVLVK